MFECIAWGVGRFNSSRKINMTISPRFIILEDLNSWNLVYEENDVATFSKGGGSDFFLRGEVVMHNGLFPA